MASQSRKTADFFMPRIQRHMIQTQRGPVWSGLYKAKFFGPRAEGEWGWYAASVLVSNNNEALAHFREWADITKAYINEQL